MKYLLFVCYALFVSCADNSTSNKSFNSNAEVIEAIREKLNEYYINPERVDSICNQLISNNHSGKYKDFHDEEAFAMQMHDELRKLSGDYHFSFWYTDPKTTTNTSLLSFNQINDEEQKRMKWANYGFQKIEILSGNVGYIKLNEFSELGLGENAATSAISAVENTNALIIDLRDNLGGDPEMVKYISSYFFGEEKVHLNDIYYRIDDDTEEFWTDPCVPGKKIDVPIYILTSQSTFSAGEEFCYNLKNLKRATIIGDTTGGGAHPIRNVYLGNGFNMTIPFAKAINPITKSNWEGIGVFPHINCSSESALNVAYKTALENLCKSSKDSMDTFKFNWALSSINAEIHPFSYDSNYLKKFIGNFDGRSFFIDSGVLQYKKGNDLFHLIPIKNNCFQIKELPFARIRMEDSNGEISKIIVEYDNGSVVKVWPL